MDFEFCREEWSSFFGLNRQEVKSFLESCSATYLEKVVMISFWLQDKKLKTEANALTIVRVYCSDFFAVSSFRRDSLIVDARNIVKRAIGKEKLYITKMITALKSEDVATITKAVSKTAYKWANYVSNNSDKFQDALERHMSLSSDYNVKKVAYVTKLAAVGISWIMDKTSELTEEKANSNLQQRLDAIAMFEEEIIFLTSLETETDEVLFTAWTNYKRKTVTITG
jgi:hypothetical protein